MPVSESDDGSGGSMSLPVAPALNRIERAPLVASGARVV
jgi:hypothetical protein